MSKKPTYEELLAKIDFYEEAINDIRKTYKGRLIAAFLLI